MIITGLYITDFKISTIDRTGDFTSVMIDAIGIDLYSIDTNWYWDLWNVKRNSRMFALKPQYSPSLLGYFLSGVMYWMTKVKTLVRALLVSAETSVRI